ncbi:MAG: universal stress protein [Bacteroidota bacterium]|nr:universal stress protein [Bacteroidota bacterium]
MKTIIFPTDLSKTADNALEYAVALALALKAKLYAIYVHRPDLIVQGIPVDTAYFQLVPVPDEIIQKMNHLKQKLGNIAGLNFHTQIKDGFLDETILELAEQKNSGLIVMGTQGAHDALSVMLGSNTSRILERKEFPVLAVPAAYTGGIMEGSNFVFATDFKDINDWEIMEPFRALAFAKKATVNLFYAHQGTEEKEWLEFEKETYYEFQSYFEGVNVELHKSHKGNVVQAVEDFAHKKNAALVMMIAHHRNWLGDLFHHSVTKEMSLSTKVPFLTLPDVKPEINLSSSMKMM